MVSTQKSSKISLCNDEIIPSSKNEEKKSTKNEDKPKSDN